MIPGSGIALNVYLLNEDPLAFVHIEDHVDRLVLGVAVGQGHHVRVGVSLSRIEVCQVEDVASQAVFAEYLPLPECEKLQELIFRSLLVPRNGK